MKKMSRTFVLVSWCVLMLGLSGPGCQSPCEEQGVRLSDNRDRKLFPDIDEDWVCATYEGKAFYLDRSEPPPPPPPPPPPDVSGDHPADPKGPKDSDAVVNAAIFLRTCMLVYNDTINDAIDDAYFTRTHIGYLQAPNDRTACFKSKTNACEAVRECLGMANQFGEFSPEPAQLINECISGTRHMLYPKGFSGLKRQFEVWYNCKGLGLECYDDWVAFPCEEQRTPCNEADVEPCKDDHPYGCSYITPDVSLSYEKLKCSDYGLTCDTQGFPGYPDCVGTGPACEIADVDWDSDYRAFDYRIGGIGCESDTMLRACVGRAEQQIECGQLGVGFKCLPGPDPHCGFANECTKDTPVTCDHDSIVLCDAGRIRKVDCKTLGFTTCDPTRGICAPSIEDQEIVQ